jgi:hypothetical protein
VIDAAGDPAVVAREIRLGLRDWLPPPRQESGTAAFGSGPRYRVDRRDSPAASETS